jgi:uncharacterized membrane protein YphA (DoxX/SURF4 family)
MLAYFILRVAFGFVLLVLGFRHLKHKESLYQTLVLRIFPFGKTATFILIIAEIVLGIMFILGYYTQIAAIIAMGISFEMLLMRNKFKTSLLPSRLMYLLFLGIALSLFITGAGAFAFDLPI